MKKAFLAIILFSAIISAFGQTAEETKSAPLTIASNPEAISLSSQFEPTGKGNWLVGVQAANIGYNINLKIFTITLTPQAGYFIRRNLAIGAELDFDMQSAYGTVYTGWGVNPFIRKYFGGAEKTKFFIQGNVGIGGNSFDSASALNYNLGATLGYSYFLNSYVALETGLAAKIIVPPGSGDAENRLGLNLGFQIHLPRKK
jgi:hypothetical protein